MRLLLTIIAWGLLYPSWAENIQLTNEEKEWIANHPTITFGGEPAWEPYLVSNTDGTFSGLEVDIIKRVNALTGLNVQIVGGDWQSMVSLAQARKIDGLVTSSPRPARRQYFNFTDEYASGNVLMYCRASDSTTFRNLGEFDGKKLGLQSGNQINHDLLVDFATPDVTDYPDIESLIEALLSEEVDYVMSGGEMTYYLSRYALSGIKTAYVIREARVPLVYSIRKDWPELVSIINKALAVIDTKERHELMAKWLLDLMPSDQVFTPGEQSWLRRTDTLSMGLLRNWPPLSINEDGVADGFIPNYFREINQELNLYLDFQFFDRRPLMEEALETDAVDAIVLGTQDSLSQGSIAFHSFPMALVSKRIRYTLDVSSLRNLRIGVTSRNPFLEAITNAYPSLEVVEVPTMQSGILQVEKGELDGFVGGLPLISYHLRQYDLTELKISAVLPMKVNLRSYSDDPILVEILNKAHLQLPANRSRELVARWYEEESKTDLVEFKWFWRVLGGFILSLIIVFAWNRSLMGQIKKRKRIESSLRSSRANLKAVIENSNALICSFDEHFCLLASNKNFADFIQELTQIRPRIGDTISDYLPAEAAERWKNRLSRSLKGETFSRTYTVQLGGERYFEATFSPIISGDRVEGVSCHGLEVTELTQLSRSFVNVLENMTNYSFVKDNALKYVAVSQSFAKLHGYDNWRDIVGKTDRDIYPEDFALRNEAMEQEILKTGDGQSNLEEEYTLATGDACWINGSKQPIRNSHGEIVGLLGMSYDFTDRRKVEQELLASKASLTALIESTTSRIYSLDREFRLVTFNANFFNLMKEMTGVSVKAGDLIIDLIPGVWRDLWRKRYQRALDGSTYDVTDRDKVMDVNRYFQTFFNPIRINEEVVGVSCFAQDITEVTRLNQIMVGLFKYSTDFVFVKDLQHRFLAASDSLAVAHGFENGDGLLGKTDFDLHPKELAESYFEYEESLLKEGRDIVNHEDEYIDKNGEKWVESNKRPLKDNHGDIVGLIGVTRDVTDRKRMETELLQARDAAEEANELKSQYIRELKRKQNELLVLNWFADSAPVGLSMADLESEEIVFVNPALLKLLDETRERDVIGKSIRQYRDDRDLQVFDEEIRPQIGKSQTWIGERRLRTAKGEILWTYEHYFLLKDEEGAPIAIANVVTDITQRRKMEADLRDKRKEADRANRAKSAFLANMSHEIRTPLNSIIGFSDLLNQMVADDLHQSYLQAIASSGKTLLALINDILDISKIESGKFEIRQVPLNLKVLAEEVRSMFAIKAREKNLEFTVKVDNPISEYLLLDELRVKQILINLLGNSFKFTNSGGVYLNILVTQALDQSYNLQFEVRDTGIGISSSAREKIFNNFYQDLDRPGQHVVGGTGLGLSIVQKLVRLMGGHIEMDSEIDQGTTFRLLFPETKIIEDITSIEESLLQAQPEELTFEQSNVLLVDDIDNNRFYLRELFRHTPILVWEARDGIEALDVIASEAIDLILTDIRMPRMDGFELAKELRKSEITAKIPIVAVTASVFGADTQLKDLFDAILYKPVLRTDLFHLLKRFIPHKVVATPTKKEVAMVQELTIGQALKAKVLQELWPEFESLKVHQPIAKVLDFAHRLQRFEGGNGEGAVLTDFGKRLESTVNNLDIAGMLDQLRAFEKMLEWQDTDE